MGGRNRYAPKRPASPSFPARPPSPKRQAQEPPKPITIAGLSQGVAKHLESEYSFPAGSVITLPAGSSIILPQGCGRVKPKNGTTIYLPEFTEGRKAILCGKATLTAPDDENITIGSSTCPSVGLPDGACITSGNVLKQPEPLKQAITLTHKLTLPSQLTLSSRGSTTLPGPLSLPSGIHFGGNHTINEKIRFQSGVVNTFNPLTLLDDVKLGGDLVLEHPMELKTNITLAGPLLLKSQMILPAATNVSQVIMPESCMEVDFTKGITLPMDAILPANFTIVARTRLASTTTLPKGTILPKNNVIPAGSIIPSGTVLPSKTVIPGGTVLPENIELQVGTILPFYAVA